MSLYEGGGIATKNTYQVKSVIPYRSQLHTALQSVHCTLPSIDR
jgi:hypothetical protein